MGWLLEAQLSADARDAGRCGLVGTPLSADAHDAGCRGPAET